MEVKLKSQITPPMPSLPFLGGAEQSFTFSASDNSITRCMQVKDALLCTARARVAMTLLVLWATESRFQSSFTKLLCVLPGGKRDTGLLPGQGGTRCHEGSVFGPSHDVWRRNLFVGPSSGVVPEYVKWVRYSQSHDGLCRCEPSRSRGTRG